MFMTVHERKRGAGLKPATAAQFFLLLAALSHSLDVGIALGVVFDEKQKDASTQSAAGWIADRERRMVRSELLEVITVFMTVVSLRFDFCLDCRASS
jgi:hypothetical protein